jgi:hypothetical protein
MMIVMRGLGRHVLLNAWVLFEAAAAPAARECCCGHYKRAIAVARRACRSGEPPVKC